MLVDYKVIEVLLRHAPGPEFNEVPENITAGSELVFDVMVSDLDGINDVTVIQPFQKRMVQSFGRVSSILIQSA